MNVKVNQQLLSAVDEGDLGSVRCLINDYGLHSSEGCGIVLLRRSIIRKHNEITKLLLCSGAKVNSNRSKLIPSNTPLHFAVENGDIEIIELLLHHNANIDTLNQNGLTPLICGVDMNNEEIVDLLLKRGCNVNYYKRLSPLHVAVMKSLYNARLKQTENTPMVKLLLKHGANVNCISGEGEAPLHSAARYGNVELIKLLLSNNADVNVRDKTMLTPLHVAIESSSRDAVQCLIDHGANIDAESKTGETALYLAVWKKLPTIVEDILKHHPDMENKSNKKSLIIAVKMSTNTMVENLLKHGLHVDRDYMNDIDLLHNAIQMGYIQIIQDLMRHGPDLVLNKEENRTVLHIATKYKQVEIAKLLITHGADVNAIDKAGKPAIYYSTENKNVIMTKFLLSYGASVQQSPELLRIACKTVCKEIVEILIENKVDIQATDKYGMTALHLTVLNEYEESEILAEEKGEIARLLLSAGADVNAKTNKNSLTTLHIACQKQLTSVVKVLLEYKADVNCTVKDCSPLLITAQNGNASIMEMLLANGADVYSKQNNGDTALHIVARKQHVDALKVLLNNAADVTSKNNKGATPLHEAVKQSNLDIIHILLQNGSPINSKDMNGDTPLHLAVCASNIKVTTLLLDNGSDINILNIHNETAAQLAHHAFSSSRNIRIFEGYYNYEYDYDNEFLDYDRAEDEKICEQILDILKWHIIMLQNANFYVIEQNIAFLERDTSQELSHEPFRNEIIKLKLEKIPKNKLSFYDILTKNLHLLARYAGNEDVIQVFETDDYESRFPIYGSMIKRNFQKAFQRRSLLERAGELLEYYFQLPYGCCDNILNYLSNADLENIIKARNTPSTLQ